MRYGTDVEFMVMDKNEKLIPYAEILGTHKKVRVSKHVWVTPDNVTVEFFVTPSGSIEDLYEKVEEGISEFQKQFGLYLLQTSARSFNLSELQEYNRPEYNKANPFMIGCSADRSVWESEERKYDPRKNPWRFAGAHIHTELPTLRDIRIIFNTIMVYDAVALLILKNMSDADIDNVQKRREHYQAGIHRINMRYKTLEYRAFGSEIFKPEYKTQCLYHLQKASEVIQHLTQNSIELDRPSMVFVKNQVNHSQYCARTAQMFTTMIREKTSIKWEIGNV